MPPCLLSLFHNNSSTTTPVAPEITPLAPTKSKPAKALVPTKKQPDAALSLAPVPQQSSKTTPGAPEIAPLTTTKATKKEPLKSPASTQPSKEAVPIKTESTQSATSEEINRDLSDEELEELLQSLDAPTADLPLIADP